MTNHGHWVDDMSRRRLNAQNWRYINVIFWLLTGQQELMLSEMEQDSMRLGKFNKYLTEVFFSFGKGKQIERVALIFRHGNTIFTKMNRLPSELYINDKIGMLYEGAEQRSVLHETGQTWFDHAECNTLLRFAPECCILIITCHFVILPT